MQELQNQAEDLERAIQQAITRLDISALEKKLGGLQEQSRRPDFWSEPDKAKGIMQEQSRLESRIRPWRDLEKETAEISEMIGLGDKSLQAELEEKLPKLQAQYARLHKELQFSGPYDDHDAILSLHAGVGGTDAQDWTQMLERMYARWAEKTGCKIVVLDESGGDEAGIKSATLEVSGPFVYGKLKGEHGVHRLVRQSPFNADNLRQTSFAKVEVMPKLDQPDSLQIDDKDLKIDVYRSGGKGGQSVNTTDSAVRINHLPTGITVAIQNERSQLQNKETAMTILRSRLAQLQLEQHAEKLEQLKGPSQSAEWGNQIRSYVLHPYKMVKDLRTGYETSDTDEVLDGGLDQFIEAYLDKQPAS